MCLSDPDTAILIGGEADDQASCKDSLWKLEIGACIYIFTYPYAKLVLKVNKYLKVLKIYSTSDNLYYAFMLFNCSDSDFWFPVNNATSEENPPSSRGHSATFDPESKVVYVYGGLRDGQRYSDIYVLDTIMWKWKLVTVSKTLE